jgi:hypothetical protein
MAETKGLGQVKGWQRRYVLRWGVVGAALFAVGCQTVPKAPPKPVAPPKEDGVTQGLPTDAARRLPMRRIWRFWIQAANASA